jgi:hypothetical protein
MSAELIHDADAAEAVAEGDQPLAQELYPHRWAIRLRNFRRQQCRDPIASHETSHRRAGAGLCQKTILFARGHGATM